MARTAAAYYRLLTSLLDVLINAYPEVVFDKFVNLVARPLIQGEEMDEVELDQPIAA